MRRIKELVYRASQDFELAKKEKEIKEYVTATILYNKAMEKVLKALFISKTKKEPPLNASIGYLVRHTGVPEEISVYISSLEEKIGAEEPEQLSDLGSYREIETGRSTEGRVLYMEGLTKRLLDYVAAYVKM